MTDTENGLPDQEPEHGLPDQEPEHGLPGQESQNDLPGQKSGQQTPDLFQAQILNANSHFTTRLEQLTRDLESRSLQQGSQQDKLNDAVATQQTLVTAEKDIAAALAELAAKLSMLEQLNAQLFGREQEGLYVTIDTLIADAGSKLKGAQLMLGSQEKNTGLLGDYGTISYAHTELDKKAADFWKKEEKKKPEERDATKYNMLRREADTCFMRLQAFSGQISNVKTGIATEENFIADLDKLKELGSKDRLNFFDKGIRDLTIDLGVKNQELAMVQTNIRKNSTTINALRAELSNLGDEITNIQTSSERTQALLELINNTGLLHEDASREIAASNGALDTLRDINSSLDTGKGELIRIINAIKAKIDELFEAALTSLNLNQGRNYGIEDGITARIRTIEEYNALLVDAMGGILQALADDNMTKPEELDTKDLTGATAKLEEVIRAKTITPERLATLKAGAALNIATQLEGAFSLAATEETIPGSSEQPSGEPVVIEVED